MGCSIGGTPRNHLIRTESASSHPENPKGFSLSEFLSTLPAAVIETEEKGFISAYSLYSVIKGSQGKNSRQKPEVKG